jgi:raffinose/stachyose/melibiose transport system substrate-binding protein
MLYVFSSALAGTGKFRITLENRLEKEDLILKKQLLAAFLVISMCAALFAGCGGVSTDTGAAPAAPAADGGAPQAAAPAASAEAQQITWMFWDDLYASQDLITIGYREVIDRFNAANEGKYFANVVTSNLEEYDTKVNALIAANQTPDVFICNPGPNLTQYVEGGIAADLTPILNGPESAWFSTFSDGIFERLTYDGKIMAIPTNFAAACVYYNTEIFAEVGVEPPKTFDELLVACQKIKDAGYTPISCSAGTAWCLSMIAGYLCDREGGPDNLQGVNDGTLDWTSPTFIAAGNKLAELSQYFQSTAAGDSNDQATASFYNGEAGMLVQGSWAIGQINGNNPAFEEKCGVFQFPGITGGADPNRIIVKTDNLVMSSKTQYQDASIALMKQFTDTTAAKYTAEIGGKIPVTSVEIDYNVAPAQLSYIQDILKTTTGTFGFYNESLVSVEAGDVFDNAMVDLFLGDVNSQEAFQKVQDFYVDNVWNR